MSAAFELSDRSKELLDMLDLGPIAGVFHSIGLAEEVMQEVGNPGGLFLLLRPSDVLEKKADEVVLHHMREIAARFEAGEDTRPGTDAEVLCGLLGAALIAPLESNALALCEQLFVEVMGRPLGDQPIGREHYPGALDEALSEARRKLWQPNRMGGVS